MSASFEIAIPDTGQALPLGEVPLSIGRGPTNDLVLADDAVSWHHAQLWLEGGHPWLRDLGSRNGTFVNGQRCMGAQRLSDGDTVRLGPLLELEVRGAATPAADPFRVRHVEDVQGGLRLLIASDRFRIGSGADCDLRLPGGAERAATVLCHDNGEIWLGTAAGDRQLEIGEVFTVAGRSLRVSEERLDHAPTVDIGAARYPYTLRLGDGASGPQATLLEDSPARSLLLTGNRGILLYVLGQAVQRHRADRVPAAEEGWCDTESVITGVWGRGGATSNHLNVLVHRTRQQLEKQGFDPWCIEKRRGAVRLRVAIVEEA
jgi:hypothetical protein